MASLTGQLVAETYKALLKLIDNDILTASEKQITDGFGGGSNVFIDSQGFLRANKYKVTNGLATQFLKADGSLDSNAYLTSITGAQVITALGYTPVPTTRTITINGETHNLAADNSWTVGGTAAIWGNITGTLSNQTDLQNALNAKYNNPTGTISQYIRGDGTLATFPTMPGGLPTGGSAGQILAKIDATDYNTHWIDNYATQTKNEVKLGQTLTKGTPVYVSSANGTNMIVSRASNTSEATSSKTLGLLESGGATNDFVKCVTFGLIAGLDTSTAQAGDPVWLGVNGALIFGLANKPYAPAHLVYIGVVTRVQSNNGEIFVNIQNGFELKEIHDVYIADPANNHGLFYDIADGLWKNKSIAGALGYTPQAQLSGTGFVKASGTTITYDNSTYLTTTDAASTYQRLDKMVSNLLPSATEYPNSNAVINALALKADAANPVFTGNMTISSAEPKLYFTDTDQNPDYFIGVDAGFFRVYDQTAGATRFVINSDGNISTGVGKSITAGSFIKDGGTATQFLKADGSIDSSTYVTSASLANYLLVTTAASTYQRLDKMVSNLLPSSTEYPNSNAVINALALKADAANPVFTGNMTISGATPRLYFVDTDQNPDYTVFIDSGYFYIYDQTAGATRFSINSSGNINTGVGKSITAGSFIKESGTASQYLMADGSVSTFSGVTGSGSGNYITKWATGSTIGNSIIYDNGSSVGIGATTLIKKLEVITGNGVTDGIRLTYANGVTAEGMDITYLNSGATTTSFDSLYNSAAAVMQFRMKTAATAITAMSIFGTGNVMIGTTVDQGFKLAVNGTARFYDNLQFSAGDRGLECSGSAGVSFYSNEINSGSQGVAGDLYLGWRRTNNINIFPPIVSSSSIKAIGLKAYGGGSIGIVPTSYGSNGFVTFRNTSDSATRWNIYNYTGGGTTYGSLNFSDGAGTDRFVINEGGAATLSSSLTANGTISSSNGAGSGITLANGSIYTSQANSEDDILVNIVGYNGGTTQNRNFRVYDGKSNVIFRTFGGSQNVAIGSNTDSGFKFDVIGTGRFTSALYANSVRSDNGITNTGNSFEQVLGTPYFTHGVSNLACDLILGNNSFWGYIEVEVTGTYSNQNTPGKLTKVFSVGTNPGGSIYNNESRIVDAMGEVVNNISIGNFQWDSSRGSFIIPISHIVSSGNGYSVRVRMFTHGSGAYNVFNSLNISPLYTLSALSRNYVYYNDRVGIGTTSPTGMLHIYNSNPAFRIQNSLGGNLQFGQWDTVNNRIEGSGGLPMLITSYSQPIKFGIDGSENMRVSTYGQFLINATSSGFGSYGYGYMLGMRGVSSQAYMSIARSTQTLDTQGLIVGLDTSYARFHVRDAIGISFGTSDIGERMVVGGNGNVMIGTASDAGYKLYVSGQTISINNGSTAEFRVQGGGYGTAYNTSLRSLPGAIAVLQFGNNGDNYILAGNTNTGGNLQIRVNCSSESISSGTAALTFASSAAATFYSSVTATSFFESSDFRLKTLIESNPIINGIENLEAKLYEKNGKIELGYFAQDAELIMPYAVTKNADGFLNLSYREVHTAKIARLEQRVLELEKQLNVA